MHKLSILFFFLSVVTHSGSSQTPATSELFTHADTLRGSDGPERSWWDVTKYDLTVRPEYSTRSITGKNIISFMAVKDGRVMQVDLQQPMEIESVIYAGKTLKAQREGNLYHINFGKNVAAGTAGQLTVIFAGKPTESVKPPWDGGWIWKTDAGGAPWMSVACQGLGASVWYPCKDYQGDEPDSATLSITVPDTLMGIGNGRLRNTVKNNDHTVTYCWAVINPIANYCIIPYIGRYTHWGQAFDGLKGQLDCDFWVLREDEFRARKQFTQVPDMLRCFEHWFGPYPFYEDGYKLVEAPHLGMEHQSAVAYGNKFENGYLGKDMSGTGWGLKWDFIIVHESAHEWFGNNITTKDLADMWVHEGFTNYGETLFTECQYGKQAGSEYNIGARRTIVNDIPVIAPYGVNREGSVDMYCKASSMIHTIRQLIGNDETFRAILQGLNKTFYHKTVTSAEIESYMTTESGIDLSKIFDQYLRTTKVPTFEYRYDDGALVYRWTTCVSGFNMPLKIAGVKDITLKPTTQWQSIPLPSSNFAIDPNFYINSRKL